MASGTPVGNMIIRVDLDAVGLEKSMTGLQRQLKSSNKAMGAQLSAFDRGEKSVSKYGVLIEGLSNRHKIQGKMVEEARIKYNQMSETYGENSVKAQQAAQQLNEQIARYEETGRELNKVQSEFKEFQRLQKIQNTGWYKAADSMEEYGGKLKTAGTQMDETGKTLTKKVSVPLGVVGGLAIKTGSDFESGMSRVGAVSGASADDMAKLEVKAREMGATTVFSATEASDAMYYMSLAGWSAEESMDGISGVMDLAAASGEDLALVSDIVTDGLTAFGLQAKDSGRMADVLASASANANTDVTGLGQAFKYVAPVAGALGFTMEDTSKAIGLMSNSGIKAEKAGTALRTMMTNLAKPTDAAEAAMKRYGISLTDSEGNMKTFDEVMLNLRNSLGDLNEKQQAQAASAIFGKEAMSGALAIINASEKDYKQLSKAIQESDGSAKEMAETMQDNLQGSIKELRSMMEDLFITMYKNLKPALESTVDGAKDLTQWFANLSPETQELITKMGLLAFTGGPVISMAGKLTSGLGSVMETTGGLVKAIGTTQGSGLVAGLNYLGPGAVAGIAVAGIGAVAYGVQHFRKKAEKAKEVNLDLSKSFTEQAGDLEVSADTFDKLSQKAKISNEKLARLNDLNIQISESSNPEEIEQLQKQYDELAKNSGLSKDELKELFEANKLIIEQSPDVEKSVSDEGNAFAKNTEKVREYIDSLYEMSMIELEAERTKQLAQEKEIRKELRASQEKENELMGMQADLASAYKGEVTDVEKRHQEINDRMTELNSSGMDQKQIQKEQNILRGERNILNAIAEGDMEKAGQLYAEHLEKAQELTSEQRETTSSKQEELDKIEAIDEQMADIVLKQAGINEEGEKGLRQLDEQLAKDREEIQQLEEKAQTIEGLTKQEGERLKTLLERNEKQKEVKDYLNGELDVYADINSLANAQLDLLSEEGQKRVQNIEGVKELKNNEQDIVQQLDKKLEKLTKERSELEKNREKQGANTKEIDKQINKVDRKIGKQAESKKRVLEELGLWEKLNTEAQENINKEIEKGIEAGNTETIYDSQGEAINNNNKKTDAGIKKEKQRTAEAGKDVDKDVNASDNGTVAKIDFKAEARKRKFLEVYDGGTISILDRNVSASKRKRINVYQSGLSSLEETVSRPISKQVTLYQELKSKMYAKGTPPSGHPGGHAVIGEEGRELVRLPDGRSFISPSTHTLLDLPKGTHVTPNKDTERLIRNIPRYASGTDNWEDSLKDSEFARLLALNSRSKSTVTLQNNNEENQGLVELLEATIQQNQILMKILKSQDRTTQAIDNKDTDIVMDSRTVGKIIGNRINKNIAEDSWAKGGI